MMKELWIVTMLMQLVCITSKAQFGNQQTCGGDDSFAFGQMLSADLNNDGADEIIGFRNDRIRIWQHNGPLNFYPPVDHFYELGEISISHAADVDADGFVDLVISNVQYFDSAFVNGARMNIPPIGPPMFFVLGKIFILRNEGDLTFSPPLLVSKNMGLIVDMEVTNLDDTPELEIIATGQSSFLGIVNEYLPRTSIFYSHAYLDTVPSQEHILVVDTLNPNTIANFTTGDWDGDGDKDIMLNNTVDSALICFDNQGLLSFSPSDTISTTPYNVVRLESSKLNLDAYDDLVVTGRIDAYNAHLSAIFNNEGNLHENPIRIDSLYTDVYANQIYFEVMDVNEDAYPDIVLPYPWLGAFINQQNNNFTEEPLYLQRDNFWSSDTYIPHAIDNSIINDLITITNSYNFNIGVYQNPYENSPQFTLVYPSCVGYPQAVKAADFTGDDQTDLLLYSGSLNFLSLLSEFEDSAFTQRSALYPIAGFGNFQTEDFDQDGDLDLAIETGYYGKVHIALNNGSGEFPDTTVYEGFQTGQYDLECADVNEDGFIDILVSKYYTAWGMNEQSSRIGVLVNNGDATFQPMVQSPYIFMAGGRLLPVDWDNDGLVDVISRNDSGIVWIKNQGNLNWGPAKVLTNPEVYSFPVKHDMNNDGHLDLVYLDYTEQRNLVTILNLPDTNFTIQVLVDSVDGAVPYLMSDINFDGIPDLITSSYENQTIQYAILDNNSTQANFIPIADSVRCASLTLGDLNNDGLEDLIGIDTYSNTTFWFFRDPGSTTFIREREEENRIMIVPNPNNGTFEIAGLSGENVNSITVCSLEGRAVMHVINNHESNFSISQKLPTGMYIVTIETNKKTHHLSMVVED